MPMTLLVWEPVFSPVDVVALIKPGCNDYDVLTPGKGRL